MLYFALARSAIGQSRTGQPILGVTDSRTDSRTSFVGGEHGLAELEQRVNSGRSQQVLCSYAHSTDIRAPGITIAPTATAKP
jgi:uncharacterized protein (DUF1015 family)